MKIPSEAELIDFGRRAQWLNDEALQLQEKADDYRERDNDGAANEAEYIAEKYETFAADIETLVDLVRELAAVSR